MPTTPKVRLAILFALSVITAAACAVPPEMENGAADEAAVMDAVPTEDVADTGSDTGSSADEQAGADLAGDAQGEPDAPLDEDGADRVDPRQPEAPCAGEHVEYADLVYTSAHDDGLLDLYVPGDGGPCPLLVYVHGGGWKAGTKTLFRPIRERFLSFLDGKIAVASIHYRLSGDAKFPAQIYDVKAAVRWLRANADAMNIDADRIVLIGTSAGGHLATLAATSNGVADLEDLTLGSPDHSSDVQGLIDCYGPVDFAQMDPMLAANPNCGPDDVEVHSAGDSSEASLLGCTGGLDTCPEDVARANPITYLDAQDPPALLGYGELDCTVPYQQGELLFDAYTEVGVEVDLTIHADSGHEWSTCPDDGAINDYLATIFD